MWLGRRVTAINFEYWIYYMAMPGPTTLPFFAVQKKEDPRKTVWQISHLAYA